MVREKTPGFGPIYDQSAQIGWSLRAPADAQAGLRTVICVTSVLPKWNVAAQEQR